MSNRMIAFALFFLIPLSANAIDMNLSNGLMTVSYIFYIVVPVLLVHLIATVYFHNKGYYRNKSFTTKHLIIAMSVPIMGIALLIFEYLSNMNRAGMHIGTFLSILFVYGFLSLVFAIPYLLYLAAPEK
ncbi:tellurite resistance protein TehA-like permease [Psychrobacter sp. PL15]|uniref:hypothetical protein n=1 Tax=unclassified Psychrobacter TaxID=196806 RepID=UPI001AE608B9|nr:hypothetical protein [Psychrobacter sp. PL15]MEC5209929.1 tellurite resistance protein TehA-like permease [Psychrobacter sp. PL15]